MPTRAQSWVTGLVRTTTPPPMESRNGLSAAERVVARLRRLQTCDFPDGEPGKVERDSKLASVALRSRFVIGAKKTTNARPRMIHVSVTWKAWGYCHQRLASDGLSVFPRRRAASLLIVLAVRRSSFSGRVRTFGPGASALRQRLGGLRSMEPHGGATRALPSSLASMLTRVEPRFDGSARWSCDQSALLDPISGVATLALLGKQSFIDQKGQEATKVHFGPCSLHDVALGEAGRELFAG